MSRVAEKNYYLFKGFIIGAKNTGKTTFLSQMQNSSPDDKEQVNPIYYKKYDRIGGKLRVEAEIMETPQRYLDFDTESFPAYKAIMFVLFDLSRPATFFESKGEKTANVMYMMNEVSFLNRNPKIVKILIGTNLGTNTVKRL